MIILHCAYFAAPYAGNFIRSLNALELSLTERGDKTAYVFPVEVQKQSWWEEFSANHEAYTTVRRKEKERSCELVAIIRKVNPSIIHTHFEGYDVPVAKAVKLCHSNAHIVWHMHDVLTYHQNPLKRFYQYYCFIRHYWYYGERVSAIGVSTQILDFTKQYRRLLGGNFRHEAVIENGVDFSRLSLKQNYQRHEPFTFLTFGGRNVQKRVDLLLEAASKLVDKYDIRVLITKGVDTEQVVETLFKGTIPEWCKVIPQSDDINTIFEQVDCFVSTSLHETFSYAICEASVYGLPVIQSDIEGTMWNAENPSSFLFESENVEDLERTMKKVIEYDKEKLRMNCLQTRQNNVSTYSIDNWCNRIMDFYTDLL